MADGKYSIDEIRISVRDPDVTKVYIYMTADAECPHLIQGWHYKEFPASIPSIKLMEEIWSKGSEDPIFWPHKQPELVDYVDGQEQSDFAWKMVEGEMLPEWASSLAFGQYLLNAQLPTRDGRRMGNAMVTAIEFPTNQEIVEGKKILFTIVTDAGNEMKMTRDELHECFHPPIYIMKERVK